MLGLAINALEVPSVKIMTQVAGALLAGAALLPAVATAQPVQGFYIGLGAGANLAGNLLSAQETTKLYTTVGPVGLLDLGWGFGNGFRAEVEGSYRSNSISGISTRRGNGALSPLSNATGDARTYAVMANLDYDIPIHPFGLPLQPYVGAGVGYGWLDLGNASGNGFATFGVPGNNAVSAPDRVSFGSAGAFAYQAMVGTSIPLSFVPGLSATLEYRFFGMARTDVSIDRVSTTSTVNGVLPSSSLHTGFLETDQSILIGLRYAFGSAPTSLPPVAPVAEQPPAPAPARSYLVFFDWDKATLTDRARQIIADAASASTKVQVTRIETNGYTDTSGTPKYNQALSIRRAEAVAAELVKDGVPKAAISIQGFGETHLLVATGPGVREPQNRRVEIIIH
jgi:opacity protein-like surface antigen